jgi:predicted transcriptional regulator
MTTISEQEFYVLNGVHLKKMATVEEIGLAVGIDPATVATLLEAAASSGLVMNMEGQHLLLPEGTSAVHGYYRTAYEAMRSSAPLAAWYDRFEALNEQFIKQVSDWQSNDGDERIQGRLIKTVERLMKNLEEIIPDIPRYRNYARRFTDSVALVDAGNKDYVCKPTIDSIHNVWFEFHEDILSVLGRPRDT